MTTEEFELLLAETSLRPAPTEAAVAFAIFTAAVIFTIFGIIIGWLIGWSMCLMAYRRDK